MNKAFGDNTQLLARKGVYPYEWFDNEDKFNYPVLPTKEEFYSKLSQCGPNDEDYKHACNVYKELNCAKFKDYHDAY